MKYRLIGTVDALKWTGDNLGDMKRLTGRNRSVTVEDDGVLVVLIDNNNPLHIPVGNWLIINESGHAHHCSNAHFFAVYGE